MEFGLEEKAGQDPSQKARDESAQALRGVVFSTVQSLKKDAKASDEWDRTVVTRGKDVVSPAPLGYDHWIGRTGPSTLFLTLQQCSFPCGTRYTTLNPKP